MGIAVASAGFFSYRKFAYDDSLRLRRNPRQQHSSLDDYLKEAATTEEKTTPAPGETPAETPASKSEEN